MKATWVLTRPSPDHRSFVFKGSASRTASGPSRKRKDQRVYLSHIRDAINDIEEYIGGPRRVRGRADSLSAIIRKLEILAKPSSSSPINEDRRPELPRKQIAGMRDRLTRDYFGVDLALVWRVVERDLPTLKAAVMALL